MWNWNKLQETKDFSYLFKFAKWGIKLKTDNSNKSKLVSDEAYNSYIAKIGLNDDYNKLLELRKEYIDNRCEWLLNKNYQSKMKSKFLNIDIKGIEKSMSEKISSTVSDTTRYIESSMGFKLNLKSINVIEFFDYVEFVIKSKTAV